MMIMPTAREQDDGTGTDTPYVGTLHHLSDRPSSVNTNSSSDDPYHEFLRMQRKV